MPHIDERGRRWWTISLGGTVIQRVFGKEDDASRYAAQVQRTVLDPRAALGLTEMTEEEITSCGDTLIGIEAGSTSLRIRTETRPLFSDPMTDEELKKLIAGEYKFPTTDHTEWVPFFSGVNGRIDKCETEEDFTLCEAACERLEQEMKPHSADRMRDWAPTLRRRLSARRKSRQPLPGWDETDHAPTRGTADAVETKEAPTEDSADTPAPRVKPARRGPKPKKATTKAA